MNFKPTTLITLFCLICTTIFGQEVTGELKGIVKDQDSDVPLAYVNIAIPELSRGTSSDENGSFILENIPVGRYTIQISYLDILNFCREQHMGTEAEIGSAYSTIRYFFF